MESAAGWHHRPARVIMSILPLRRPGSEGSKHEPGPRGLAITPPTVELDERSVLEALRAGDLKALEEVLRAYWGPVVAYASRILDDTDAARDVAQETFIRIWGNATRWRTGSLSGLVFRVARNLCVDEL